jgi:hypothetical protein
MTGNKENGPLLISLRVMSDGPFSLSLFPCRPLFPSSKTSADFTGSCRRSDGVGSGP